MDLKSVLSRVAGKSEGSSPQEQYLAVKISQSEVLATLWSVISGQVTIGHVGGQKITGKDFAGLLSAADAAVSTALGPKELPAAKTIFGVNPDWVNEGKIVEEKRQLLKFLCQELDLRPLGYVLLSDAVENYLTGIEGAPLTAILVSLEGNGGWVSLSQAGKNLGTVPLPQNEKGLPDLASKMEKTLRQFTQVEVLPARIILFDGPQLQVSEEKIMAHPWTKQLPFLHFPKVEILPGETVVRAVAAASGTQMGGKIEITNDQLPMTNEGLTEPKPKPELEEVDAAQAGFVFGEEKTTIEEIKPETKPAPEAPPPVSKIDFSVFTNKIKNIFSRIRLFSPAGEKPPKLIFLGAVGLALLLLLLGAGLYFFPKAKLIVHLTPKTFTRELTATISGQTIDATELGTKKGVVTGQKLVGNKAAGSVTIYGASLAKTFPAGTILISPDGLKFTLDQEASVASASDFLSPATAMSKITAADIGDKYNLAPNTKFSLGNSSLYLAKNDATLTGGNSHEATVVTKTDQDRLLATLSAELAQKAQADLKAKLPAGQTLLPNAVTATVAKKSFSKEVDTEGDTVSLDLTVDYKGVTVSQTDLISRFKEKFPQDIPVGYALDETASQPEIKFSKLDKNGNVVLDVWLNGVALAQLDSAKIISLVAGKSLATADKIIRGQTGVSAVVVTAQPKFFQFLINRFLPWKTQNISLETVSD